MGNLRSKLGNRFPLSLYKRKLVLSERSVEVQVPWMG